MIDTQELTKHIITINDYSSYPLSALGSEAALNNLLLSCQKSSV